MDREEFENNLKKAINTAATIKKIRSDTDSRTH